MPLLNGSRHRWCFRRRESSLQSRLTAAFTPPQGHCRHGAWHRREAVCWASYGTKSWPLGKHVDIKISSLPAALARIRSHPESHIQPDSRDRTQFYLVQGMIALVGLSRRSPEIFYKQGSPSTPCSSVGWNSPLLEAPVCDAS